MREVGIVGVGHTKFGKSDLPFLDLLGAAALEALDDAGIKTGEGHCVDQLFVSSMGASIQNRISGSASALVDSLNLRPAMAECVENGPASGGSAVKLGYMAIASGMCDCVLVVGGEKMGKGKEATDFVATMLHPEAEYPYGLTLTSFAAMFTRLIMDKYGVTSEDLARIAVKNHANACHNPVAQLQKPVSLEAITTGPDMEKINPPVAEPLRRYDVCPMSDGAAAVVLCAMDIADKFKRRPVRIAGIGQATDTHCVANRAVPTDLLAVRLASQKAYKMAGLTADDMDCAELHDAFQILELVESEEAGFFPRGQGHIGIRNGETEIGGRIPINTSGGLKAKGHPLGATGISQIIEVVKQLRGEAAGRQVEGAKAGLCVNFGGFGNNVVATVLTKD